ncbi:hypothetical protein [Actinokineospora sp. UTMC 2448]|uniref:hypothetical protein n=1 Tax=Actinokineospora sp. UTMC 2448 TaxID=2268449 RepID=UPI0021648F51|nr:hypothetical protein [Actinokineospora sp. UTMC 2448]
MEASAWPSDQPIYDLIAQMAAEAGELMEDPAAGMEMDQRLYGVASQVLSISPPVVWDTFARYSFPLREGHVTELNDTLSHITLSLEDWNGAAADAFRRHIGRIGTFLDNQRTHVDKLLRFFLAAYSLATEAREDMKTAMEHWMSVSRQFRADEEAKTLATGIKVGVALVAGAVGVITSGGTLLAVGLTVGAAMAAGAAEVVTAPMGGASKEDVLASADGAMRKLVERYDDGVAYLKNEIRAYLGELTPVSDLFEPLPTFTDVDSPDFRYEHFHHQAYFSETFGAEVDRAHEIHVKKQESGGGLIGRRLEGGDT